MSCVTKRKLCWFRESFCIRRRRRSARFRPIRLTYWWLAQYELTNYDAGAVADQDLDGLLTWQEYVAGTNPTNPASVFKITGNSVSSQGDVIRWSSVSNRFYDLSRTTNLMEAFSSLVGASNLPATPPRECLYQCAEQRRGFLQNQCA